MLQLKSREAADSVLAPKVEGTLLLESLLSGEPLDFFVLCSSVNAIFGGFGAIDYCAANAFQDALSASRAAQGRSAMISINWDAWQEVGMAANMNVPADVRAAREESLRYGIRPAEGIEALDRILVAGLPQTAVVTRDLRAMLDSLGIFVAKNALATAGLHADVISQDPNAGGLSSAKHERPELPNEYVAPRNDSEQMLCAIWSDLLGIEPVGAQDNFFDLGGHSLLATRVLSRVQDQFKVRLPLRTIFEAPTIAELAERLQAVSWAVQSPVAAGTDAENAREEIDL